MKSLCVIMFVAIFISFVEPTTIYSNSLDIPNQSSFFNMPIFGNAFRRRCPLCDSSVDSYCTDKLFHDSCCCHNPNNPYDRLPYQCKFADCSFLHANSCPEHKLITACCCIRLLY